MVDALATERMVLAVPDPIADLEPLHALFANPAVWTHAPASRHTDLAQTREWLETVTARWERDGLSYWVARSRSPGRELVGIGGVGRHVTGAWNVFYRLEPAFHGRGLASELAAVGLAAAAEADASVPCIAWIRPGHTASVRVARRIGLSHRGARVDPSDRVTRMAYADRPLDDRYGAPVSAAG